MKLNLVFIVLIIAAIYQTEAAPKLGLVKAKVALAKAPHVIAHVAVAKEVKAKTGIALAKTVAAAKAAKVAAVSAITAPFRVAKKTLALKIGAVKVAKAAKLAKLAKGAAIIHNLKKGPIVLPVPVAVPVKSLPVPLVAPKVLAAPAPLFNIPPPSISQLPLGQIRDFISGAQRFIQTATSGIPFSNAKSAQKVIEPIVVTPAPVLRFVPDIDFTQFNRVSYQPQVNIDVPVISASTYELPLPLSSPPHVPAATYGPPN